MSQDNKRRKTSRSRNSLPVISVIITRTQETEQDIIDAAGDDEMCPESFDVQILADSFEAGKAHIMVVGRGSFGGPDLQRTCDEYSGELASVVAFCCDKRGKADYRTSMHGYDNVDGGFLLISSFHIDEDQTAADATWIGANALRRILSHPTLSPKWSLAVYCPEAEEQMNKAQYNNTRWSHNDTREQFIAKRTALMRHCQLDARQFFRSGFRQVTPPSLKQGDRYHLFAVPSFVKWDNNPMITDAEARRMPIVDAPSRPVPPLGVDKCMEELVEAESMVAISNDAARQHLRQMESSIRRLMQEGGDIGRSCALHICSRNGKLDQVDLLLQIVGPGSSVEALNRLNEEGQTPLMVAARSATSSFLMPDPYAANIPSAVGICADLISRGANKGVVDCVTGLTALGHMRKRAVEMMHMMDGHEDVMERLEPLTRVLMPLTGPNLADNYILPIMAVADDNLIN